MYRPLLINVRGLIILALLAALSYICITSNVKLKSEENDLVHMLRNSNVEAILKSQGWYNRSHLYFHGEGVVIPVGNRYSLPAIHTIKSLRMAGYRGPIEISYMGDQDLHITRREAIEKIDSLISFNDLSIHFKSNAPRGWNIKPFSILFTKFEKVALIDADVVFPSNVEELFQDRIFRETGTLFFTDRQVKKRKDNPFFQLSNHFKVRWSENIVKTLLYQNKSDHLQESGVVLVDRGRNLLGVLGACLLSIEQHAEWIQKIFYGEKENYWIGFELAGLKYGFAESTPGTIGQGMISRTNRSEFMICGHLAHFNREGQILWFNDGLVVNKHISDYRIANFTHKATEGQWRDICLLTTKISAVGGREMDLIKKLVESIEEDSSNFSIKGNAPGLNILTKDNEN